MKGKVTGIGGVFFKSENPSVTKSWYEDTLGIPMDKYGHSFEWRDKDDPQRRCITQWSPMAANTDYYSPSQEAFMINYRVDDLDALLAKLKEKGIAQVVEIQCFSYGKFAWIMDPDGRKIELWEPQDEHLL